MDALRRKLGDRLVEAGATQALDCREMWAKCERSGVSAADNIDLQVLGLLEVLSVAAIKLGVAVMPRRLAQFHH
jgi:hypothetical protein